MYIHIDTVGSTLHITRTLAVGKWERNSCSAELECCNPRLIVNDLLYMMNILHSLPT